MKKSALALTICMIVQSQLGFAAEKTATFAGGCFWCVEAAYQDEPGVIDAISGFTGGTLLRPTYQGNHRGHYEAVQVTYDDAIISYEALTEIFWKNIDPFDNAGQFCDKGPSYRSAVFYDGPEQEAVALASKTAVAKRFPGQAIATELLAASRFWPVEDYHQDYYKKNPIRYGFYRRGCGRDARLSEVWGTESAH